MGAIDTDEQGDVVEETLVIVGSISGGSTVCMRFVDGDAHDASENKRIKGAKMSLLILCMVLLMDRFQELVERSHPGNGVDEIFK